MENSHWLVLAAGLGMITYASTGIAVNGFSMHLLYPVIMGLLNLLAVWMLRKRAPVRT